MNYESLQIPNSVEFLYLIDEQFRNETRALYPWQLEVNKYLTDFTDREKFTSQSPCRLNLPAANGSGKDAYVNALNPVYWLLCEPRFRSIITSSSGHQITSQTEPYIVAYAHAANAFLQSIGAGSFEIEIKQRHLMCPKTGSEIRLFVTDDPGMAEGYHPFPDYKDAGMAIIINEAKSVSDQISKAIQRCTGFNYWLEVSSPGQDKGFFYRNCVSAIHYPDPPKRGERYVRHVTAYDCPHFSAEELARDQREMDEQEFNSVRLAQFTSTEISAVIARNKLWECLSNKLKSPGAKVAGIDLSLGGDETVVAIREGNSLLRLYINRQKSSVDLERWLIEVLEEERCVMAYVDAGGLGEPIAQHLATKFPVTYVKNNARARRPTFYRNRGTEDWFWLANLIQRKSIVIEVTDEKLLDQLASREYKRPANSSPILKSKKEMRASGTGSPDRADAVVLCFCDYGRSAEEVAPVEESKFRTIEQIEAELEHYNGPRKQRKNNIAITDPLCLLTSSSRW